MNFFAICFQKSTAWYGCIIRKLTRSQWNHVYIEYESEDWGHNMDLDITPRGVLSLPQGKRGGIVQKYVASDNMVQYAMTEAMKKNFKKLGNRYDWTGLFMGLIRLLIWRVTGKRIMKSIHSKGRMFCSEMVSTVMRDAGIWDGVTPSEASPADVFAFAEKSLDFKKL